jgi:drug/metabolite transporter (DMT)-like permease
MTPLFSLVILLIFLRGEENVTSRTILGTVAVVAGTIAMLLESNGVKSS